MAEGRASPSLAATSSGVQPDLQRWSAPADELPWLRRPDSLWVDGPRYGTWFPGGRINAATACVSHHAEQRPDTVAVRWEGEPGDRRCLTYAALDDQVTALGRALRGLGVGVGDVVALHLGWLPETVVAMFACARIGAVHTIIPTPLPAEAMADRLTTIRARVLVTQDGAWRHGTVLPLKARADEALSAVGAIEHTVVVRRTGIDVGWYEGDRWYHDLVAGSRPGQQRDDEAPADVPADHPLAVVSLAHRRGRPLTIELGTAAVLASALVVHRCGIADGPVLWCAGDVSWLGTQVHGIYGPLVAGDTAVMFEGTLDVPTHERAWRILRRYAVTTLLTTPSVLRMLRSWSVERGVRAPGALRRVVALGEPMDPAIREFAATGLASGAVSVADAWGQVELGGIVRLDAPVDPAGMPDLGERIVDEDGAAVPLGATGEFVLTRPWAGALVGASGPAEALDEAHWTRLPGAFTTGDRARWREDGSLEFLGRTDEVVSVSGQLVSLSEVSAVLADHPYVAAVDVIERGDHLGLRVLAAAVVLHPDAPSDLAVIARELGDCARESLGGLARPRLLMVVDRFGGELEQDERRRALAGIPLGETSEPRRVSWDQVLATAGYREEGADLGW